MIIFINTSSLMAKYDLKEWGSCSPWVGGYDISISEKLKVKGVVLGP